MALLLSGCATSKPISPGPILPLKALMPAPRVPVDTNYVATIVPHAIPWQYPAGLDVNRRCWTLQSSTNLVEWTDVRSGCETDPVLLDATNAFMFFRLRSTL